MKKSNVFKIISHSSGIVLTDIHGYRTYEAQEYLENLIKYMLPEIKTIIVVHGYSHGDSLKKMVQNELNSGNIAQKIICSNPGITKIVLC